MTNGLDTRPGATTLDLKDLVGLAWAGKIRVPHFQRDFRWTGQDVTRLFDSILRRYPVGSLLLWRRPAVQTRVRLGALKIDASQVDDALWVVDGQQRMTSLANVLHPEGGKLDSRFSLGYDLRQEAVVSLHGASDPFVIPLWVVFDLVKVLDWFADNPEVSEYRSQAFELAKHLQEFSIPAYLVVQNDVQVLQDIFDRMNNYGKRLSRAEIFSALTAGPESEVDDHLTLERIADDINARFSFGKIDADTVLRAVLARRGPDVEREIRIEFDEDNWRGVQDFRDEPKEVAFSEGQQALERAVAFLVRSGVPHFTLLPYKYLLVVLTRALAHFPEPDSANERLLSRWFWRAAVLGPQAFKGGTTGAARTLCGKVHPGDLTGSVRELLEALGPATPVPPDLRRFRTNWAAPKIVLCSWWDRQPRSPETGAPYEQAELAETLIDQLTAADAVRSLFAHRRVSDRSRQWAANRVLMPSLVEPISIVGGTLLRRPLGVDEPDWRMMLDSHCISPEVERLLAEDNVQGVLDTRQLALAEVLEFFLKRKCEWGFEDTPPLAEMVLDDLPGDEDDDAA